MSSVFSFGSTTALSLTLLKREFSEKKILYKTVNEVKILLSTLLHKK